MALISTLPLRAKLASAMISVFGAAYPASADTETVIQSIIGRTLTNAQVTRTVIYPDGTLEGMFNGISFAGEWTIESGQYCRKITRGLKTAPACMNVTASKDDAGSIVGVYFETPGIRSFFSVSY